MWNSESEVHFFVLKFGFEGLIYQTEKTPEKGVEKPDKISEDSRNNQFSNK